MEALSLARAQFAVTTIYHFLFVPLTIGLSFLVAVLESVYVKTGDEKYKQMAKFWGKLFLINFSMGVVTGIVQEFQFGMNWSGYSRFVGDIFGSLLHRVNLPGCLDFWMGETVKEGSPSVNLAGSHCNILVCLLDSVGKFLHAESRWICTAEWTC